MKASHYFNTWTFKPNCLILQFASTTMVKLKAGSGDTRSPTSATLWHQ